MSTDKIQPIIIKRKKSGHAAHGGAWKIAYADFVTAMMAFFLLMWLLGSTTKGELMGISEYFQAPLKIALSGGNGSGDSTSFLKGGGKDITRTSGQVKNGNIKDQEKKINLRAADKELDLPASKFNGMPSQSSSQAQIRDQQENAQFNEILHHIEEIIVQSPDLSVFKNQLLLELTDEGLRIQIIDTDNRPMFDLSSSSLKPYAVDILKALAPELNKAPNFITISGHTDATPYKNGPAGFSNWELSSDRAHSARRSLLQAGFPDEKILRVIGHGSSVLYNPQEPRNPINRRISIVVLKTSESQKAFGSPEEITIPKAASTP